METINLKLKETNNFICLLHKNLSDDKIVSYFTSNLKNAEKILAIKNIKVAITDINNKNLIKLIESYNVPIILVKTCGHKDEETPKVDDIVSSIEPDEIKKSIQFVLQKQELKDLLNKMHTYCEMMDK